MIALDTNMLVRALVADHPDQVAMHTFDRNFCTAARAAGIAPEVRIWEV
ncbi:MAG: hypothetical protein WCJ35_10625 [Planctomycetota bacterium]